ncbi:hypothetical protein DF051_25625 [Burkholderia contaminans]|uniref:Uncharacterized protein n=1 Tax=Burkholderia contaminans TaxID=488447 RepID=A0A3N8PIK7_9BURK|nr:hypothetical protein DF051_25625 [Burkholderia contaminans]
MWRGRGLVICAGDLCRTAGWPFGAWRLALGAWRLALGAWRLALGAWRLANRQDREVGRHWPMASQIASARQRDAGRWLQSEMTGLIKVVVIGAKPHARYSARAAAL